MKCIEELFFQTALALIILKAFANFRRLLDVVPCNWTLQSGAYKQQYFTVQTA